MSRKGKGESAMRRWRRQRTCRRAPVPGRSQPRIARRARLHGGSGRCQHCCARGRALSAKASARRPGAQDRFLLGVVLGTIPALLYIASHIHRGVSLINTPLQRGVRRPEAPQTVLTVSSAPDGETVETVPHALSSPPPLKRGVNESWPRRRNLSCARRPGAMTKCLDTGARLSFDAKGVWRMDYELCLLRAPDGAPRSSGAGCGIPINPPAHRNWGSCQGDWSRSMKTTTARWRYECIPNSGTDPFRVSNTG